MPDLPPSAGETGDLDLAAADRAAENLLRSPTLPPDRDPAREAALDEAFKSVTPPPAGEDTLGNENGGVRRSLEGAPDPVPAVVPDPKPVAPVEPVVPAPVPKADEPGKRKGLLDDTLPGQEPAKTTPADDAARAYEEVKLRSDASPKTQDSFNRLKEIALQREQAVRTELETTAKAKQELEAKLAEAAKSAGKLTPEVETELKELREFRALRDVESRPEIAGPFKQRTSANLESIIPHFLAEGMKPEAIEDLRKLSFEDQNTYIEKVILPKLEDGRVKTFITAKLLDNINASEERRQKIEAARGNADKILAEQREEPVRVQKEFDDKMRGHLKTLLPRLDYLFTKEIPATATPAEKKALEASNARAADLQARLKQALMENAPESRAEAALAVPMSHYYFSEYKTFKARAEAAEAKLEAIAKASETARLGKSAAPAGSAPAPAPRPANESSEDTLDNLFKEASASAPRG